MALIIVFFGFIGLYVGGAVILASRNVYYFTKGLDGAAVVVALFATLVIIAANSNLGDVAVFLGLFAPFFVYVLTFCTANDEKKDKFLIDPIFNLLGKLIVGE